MGVITVRVIAVLVVFTVRRVARGARGRKDQQKGVSHARRHTARRYSSSRYSVVEGGRRFVGDGAERPTSGASITPIAPETVPARVAW